MRRALMLRGYVLGLAALAVGLASVGYIYAGQLLNPQSAQTLPRGTVKVGDGELTVVYARTPAQGRVLGRRAPAAGEGVLYRFPAVRDDPWQGQRRAVSVAFLDSRGTILRLADLKACDPAAPRCPVYLPGMAYRGVLEAPSGWFSQNRVRPGDTVAMPPTAQ